MIKMWVLKLFSNGSPWAGGDCVNGEATCDVHLFKNREDAVNLVRKELEYCCDYIEFYTEQNDDVLEILCSRLQMTKEEIEKKYDENPEELLKFLNEKELYKLTDGGELTEYNVWWELEEREIPN